MRRVARDYVKYSFIGQWINRFRLRILQFKWIRINKENETIPMSRFNPETVKVGKGSYGELNVVSFGDKTKLTIGNFVSISEKVTFLLDVEHYTNKVSTYPFRVKILHECQFEAFSKGDIVVDDDVWIGYGATIMSGVHIGKGAVIASGAVVVKDVPPYAIVGGVPAKVIKYRFPEDIREKIGGLDFNKLTGEKIAKHIEELYQTVDSENVDGLINRLSD
jgi:acetyltransferase-like isoleucine patch superfamily enzyme